MTVEAEQTSRGAAGQGRVSGIVVHVLIDLVHDRNGDVGVAQALALADEDRSFATLGDITAWSSLDRAVALFNAVALVTGDGAVGLHVGEELLYTDDGTGFVERLRNLDSPEVAFKHVAPLVGHYDATSDAVALEVAVDHALIEVTPRSGAGRHAHICEMTRGLLSQVPALYGRGPALVTESECSARGGRFCLYALSWESDEPAGADPRATRASTDEDDRDDRRHRDRSGSEEIGSGRPASHPVDAGWGDTDRGQADWLDSDRDEADRDEFDGDQFDGDQFDQADTDWADTEWSDTDWADPDRAETDRTRSDLRAELDRMSALVEGAFATASQLVSDDVESLLTQIAARADAVVAAHRYLLMVRVRPGTPIQLHYRGLEEDEAQIVASELWRDDPDDQGGARLIVDIASPQRLYGRLVEFPPDIGDHPASEARVLRLFAEYAAAALDIFRVLTDAKRSDATTRTLLSFSQSLSRVTDIDELLQLLADVVPEVTDCDQSTIYLWDVDQGQLVPRSWTTGRVPDAGSPVGPGSPAGDHRPVASEMPASDPSPFTRIFDAGEVIVVDESTEEPVLRALLRQSGSAVSVVAPLTAGGNFLGLIGANFARDSDSVGAVAEAELHERLSGLADQAATTLQNLELMETVSHLAWHDVLTGLPNRRLFKDRVEQELVRSRRVGEPVCMFFVDLDHFKTVNDTLGHAAGDDLIQQVSRRLVDTVRRQDTVARVGGDEFAILLPGLADQDSIDQLARRSLQAMSTPFVVAGVEVETSASIGIAMAPEHGDSYDELLSRADEAMYQAKSRGPNDFQMFSRSPGADQPGRPTPDDRTLQADLVHALERDEFFVLYQPYIDLRTEQVVGVEALVRWRHPTFGVLEPISFISMAERSDLIVSLDSWVLQQGCRQLRTWLDRGVDPLRLSVNLASRDLSNPDLFESIDLTLRETGIDPSLLELEITERVVLDRNGPATKNIERLRRLGVRFTIDDFGTGNSSLSRIGSFPVSTLKIDQSFVQVLGPGDNGNTLVSAIISMADRLGLNCVAEGVETSAQSRVLLQRGCTIAQGYFFSPPLPAADFERMMADIGGSEGSAAIGGGSE